MKKLALIAGLILLVVTIPIVVYMVGQNQQIRSKAAPSSTLTFSPGQATKGVGESFTMNVDIDTGCDAGDPLGETCNHILNADIVLNYDQNILEATAVEMGSFLAGASEVRKVIDQDNGRIIYGIFVSPDQANAVAGQGTLATVTFVGSTAGSGDVSFDPTTLLYGYDEDLNVVANDQQIATFTISGDGNLSPTPTFTPTPTESGGLTGTPTPTQSGGLTGTPTPTPQGSTGVTALAVTSPANGATVTTDRPTISGTAKAGSTVTIVVYSDPVTGVVIAGSAGTWSFTPSTSLADGSHTITLTEQALDGSTRTSSSTIIVQTQAVPVSGTMGTTLLLIAAGVALLGFGLIPLFPL